MRRRILALSALLVGMAVLSPARPTGQLLPTISDDLLAARNKGQRMQVIIQSAEPDGRSLRGRARGLLRRELQDGLALDVSPSDLDALRKDPSIGHISRDIPVAGDMA